MAGGARGLGDIGDHSCWCVGTSFASNQARYRFWNQSFLRENSLGKYQSMVSNVIIWLIGYVILCGNGLAAPDDSKYGLQ